MRQPDILDEPWVHADGAGEPAVLVHGVYPGSPASFAAQRPLAEAFRLIAVDRRGYGGNPDRGGRLGWPADAEDLLRLVEALGGAHLVGHSYGGVVVGLAAGRRPDLVRSLVLVDPSLHSVAPDDPAVAAMTEAEREVAEVAASGASTREWARAWMVKGAALTGGLSRGIGAHVVVFERSTHFAPSEEPERFNRLLRETWTAAAGPAAR